MRKLLKVPLITIATIAGLIGATLGTTTIVNAVASASEAAELQPYGQLVDVDGKRMNVVISGDAPETIVLLPGQGTAAPGLDFQPLVAELRDQYRVVVVEPFGYGLSDQTDVPRTSANIAGEVHAALRGLGIDRYVLAGHSIAGITALEYLQRYHDEVTAFIGIDTSVPTQPGADEATPTDGLEALKSLGILRVLTAIAPDPTAGLPYDTATKRQLAILANRNAMNPTLLDEIAHTPANFRAARSQSFPADLPILMFVVGDDPELADWVSLHEAQLAGIDRSELVLLDGGHYLHHTESPQMGADIKRFLGDTPTG
jgi:pimeloyl-ACP methyl ester carboxylesterase